MLISCLPLFSLTSWKGVPFPFYFMFIFLPKSRITNPFFLFLFHKHVHHPNKHNSRHPLLFWPRPSYSFLPWASFFLSICLPWLSFSYMFLSFPLSHSWPVNLTLLGLHDLAWSSRFLKPQWNRTFTFYTTNVFGCFQGIIHKVQSDYIRHSSVWLSNHTQSESIHNMAAHQLQQYCQPQWVLSTISTALVMLYTCSKLTHTKILQNFWLTILYIYISLYLNRAIDVIFLVMVIQ